ncbi:MAG: response regulator [Deltaproteobacteria bacterium]|nr:response regulator [Deltaproteobacteria bacterium]
MNEAKAKILVVDDEEDILVLFKRLLEAKGFEVQTASNTMGAGYLLADFSPDLVVLDIMLPGSLSGDQACDTLRNLCPGVKIVFFSGMERGALEALGAKHKADAVISKGPRPSILVQTIHQLLEIDES